MTQRLWTATLAPIGRPSLTGRIISPDCVITTREGALLFAPDGSAIGSITDVSVIDGYLVATGTLDPNQDYPNTTPTFDGGLYDQYTFAPLNGDDPLAVGITFHTLEVSTVRTGFETDWPNNPDIGFIQNWCIHLEHTDDLIPFPNRELAELKRDEFARWWDTYRATRATEGVTLPECVATVKPWPYDDTTFNETLEDLRADDPDGWLSFTSPEAQEILRAQSQTVAKALKDLCADGPEGRSSSTNPEALGVLDSIQEVLRAQRGTATSSPGQARPETLDDLHTGNPDRLSLPPDNEETTTAWLENLDPSEVASRLARHWESISDADQDLFTDTHAAVMRLWDSISDEDRELFARAQKALVRILDARMI